MPKLKTHKATQKRVKKTKKGKLLRGQASTSHLLTNKSDRKVQYLKVDKADRKKVDRLLPNS